MITGKWGKPSQVLLDLTVTSDGSVHGIANPGRQNAPIREGHFDSATGVVTLKGEYTTDGNTTPFLISGHLVGRTLRLSYQFGEQQGAIEAVRVEEYAPRFLSFWDRVQPHIAEFKRRLNARTRPTRETNTHRLQERGESVDSIIFRDAVATDIPALAELHVTTWNATYNVRHGPSIETRAWQWNQILAKEVRRDFVLVLEDRNGRLIGFTWGRPHDGEFAGEISKIYLRWEYHGLGLGRRMMKETAQRFLDRGIRSCILFADLANPTLGFYDRLGGERLINDRGQFDGGYAWRDVRVLIA